MCVARGFPISARSSLRGFLNGPAPVVPVHGVPIERAYHGPATTLDAAGGDSGLDDTGLLDPSALTTYNFKTGIRSLSRSLQSSKIVLASHRLLVA